ncbi:hypothetical protein NAEGRDRAFT_59310 [Naegleria gruberi]|uniref:Uncharacterized protein n=1 Tax=Naegleria gruberi TaxID=5762 RepID=D2VV93_NAEGR|nr:uncharacterized protein NAEGRDRAFT_59310 [Naegleria gruberi]EFC39270.1 hypothetical protein NAEGRDRAFT_59310 [Naegleria gruberi]|eukprot:XP_002672014.1 hypothetical protein NAEGRDRAFT_59310 [Naegleria gruberi strain NEG-M]
MPVIEEYVEEEEVITIVGGLKEETKPEEIKPIGESLDAVVLSDEELEKLLAPLEEETKNEGMFRTIDFSLLCIGEVSEFVKKRNIELVERDNVAVPHFRFRIPLTKRRSEQTVKLSLSKLLNLPLDAFVFYYLVEKNHHISFETGSHLIESYNPFVVANTTLGLKEFEEYKAKVLALSKNTGYFDLDKADQIIQESETNKTIDWRAKSKEIFKLEPSADELTPEENEKWHQYFVDRVENQKKHNKYAEEEDEDSCETILKTTFSIMKNALSDIKDKSIVADFCAQACVIDFSPGYIDVGAIGSLDTLVRFHSTKSYECIELKYTFFHKARYHSHDFLTKLDYRVLPLATSDAESLKSIPWTLFFENYLDDDDRFQESDWIAIEKRNFRIFLKQLREFRTVILGNDTRYSIISDYQLLRAIYFSSTVHSGDTTLCNDDWIGYRMRTMCGCPSEADYSFEEHDFDKDIADQLKRMREEGDDEDDDDENYEDVEEGDEDDDYEDMDEFAEGNANEVMNQFLQELAFGGQKKKKGGKGGEMPPGCPQQ